MNDVAAVAAHGGGGERRCFAAPRLRRVWERFACLSRRYFDLTWLLHATFLTGIVNSRGITSSGKINSWLTNHYFLTHPHYFPVNSKALIKPSERVNATKARDLFLYTAFILQPSYLGFQCFRQTRGQKTLRLERFIQNLLIIKNKNKHGGWYALARLAGWVKWCQVIVNLALLLR